MGYDTLEDNDLAALDGSRSAGVFANDMAVKTKKVIHSKPVNVSGIIKQIAVKYSKKLESCEDAEEVINKIQDEIKDTVRLLKECKQKSPINKGRILKLKAQLIALKEQNEYVKTEKIRLECVKEMQKKQEEYANMTDVEEAPKVEEKPTIKLEKEDKNVKLLYIGAGFIGVLILAAFILKKSK
jgi:hypothetical protein